MYDILAITYLISPNLFKTEEKFISVNLDGQTKIKNGSINNCNLVTKAKPKQIKKLFFNSTNNKF